MHCTRKKQRRGRWALGVYIAARGISPARAAVKKIKYPIYRSSANANSYRTQHTRTAHITILLSVSRARALLAEDAIAVVRRRQLQQRVDDPSGAHVHGELQLLAEVLARLHALLRQLELAQVHAHPVVCVGENGCLRDRGEGHRRLQAVVV